MVQLRVVLAQINPTVGDIAGNAALIESRVGAAASAGADVVAFPEMALTGYPVEDLALRETFVQACGSRLRTLAGALADAGHGDVLVLVGYLDRDEGGVRNAVAALFGGEIIATQFKHHLPNYGVFDERRYFHAGDTLEIVRLHGVDIGMVICEDLWQDGGPVAALGEAGVGLVVAVNASPYERAKNDVRLTLATGRAREAGAPVAYVNQVGGQDDLVFDGDSLVVDPAATTLARAPQFDEHLLVTDLELEPSTSERHGEVAGMRVRRRTLPGTQRDTRRPTLPTGTTEPLDEPAQMWRALVLGLRDYARKNGFTTTLFGFSGGIDSAVCAALAADALGADALHGVAMPSKYSSEHSRSDAAVLAHNLGCHFRIEPVEDMVAAYVEPLKLTGLAEENIQARVRGMLLMALSNSHGHLVLATGNKTELAVGYSTLYGDAVGGFAPIKDVFKTQVWRLARWRNDEASRRGETPPIPEGSITKPPSAELRPGQVDTDSLPDYPLLDDLLDRYVENDHGRDELVSAGFEYAMVDRVLRMVDTAEYKRRQYPPGTKISARAFGRDRRLPMTNAWRETKH